MKTKLYRSLTVIWGLVISYFSLLPSDSMVITSLGDKAEHFIGYCALSIVASLGWKSRSIVPLSCIIFGIAIEVAQGLEGSRTPSIADAIANSLGVVAGLTLVIFLQRRSSNNINPE